MMEKKVCWYGSKQLWIMIYTAILFLIGSCVIGGNNNTVFPAFAEARGWNLDIINMISGIGCIMKAVGLLVLASTVRKLGEKKLIASQIEEVIDLLAYDPYPYLSHPDKDFTRKRRLQFKSFTPSHSFAIWNSV